MVISRNLFQALQKGQLRDAEILLFQLKQIAPFSVETRGFELELLTKQKRLEEAKRLSQECLQRFPSSGRILYLVGKLRFYQKEYAGAKSLFEESYRLTKKPVLRWWIGKCLLNEGRHDEARQLLIEATKRFSSAWRDLAWLHEKEGDFREAIRCLEELQKQEPHDRRATETIVRLKAKALSPKDLLEEIEARTGLESTPPVDLYPLYVERLLELGKKEEADAFLAKTEMPTPFAIQAGWTCYKMCFFDLSFALFQKHLAILDFKALAAFERSAEKCGRIPEIIEEYQRLAPENKKFYGRLHRLRKWESNG